MDSPPASARLTCDRDERGDTLVELLIALVIIGLAATAIIGALLVSISGSTEHRYLANDDTLARTAIDEIKQQVELPVTLSASKFVSCSTWTNASNPYVGLGVPGNGYPGLANYAVSITQAQCFNYSAGTYSLDSTCSWPGNVGSGCTSDGTHGLQKLWITVTDPSGYKVTMATIIRNPNYG